MSDDQKLNIIDENGKIIGEETRENIHRQGLLHREINVWFYTPAGEIIFQHRGKNKDTYPNLLDATVGGHVEIGSDYLDTALKEIAEEAGINVKASDLILLKTVKSKSQDQITGKINYKIQAIFAYGYQEKIEDLLIEDGEATGFEAIDLKKLLTMSEPDKEKFVPSIFSPSGLDVFKTIQGLLQ
ncbi:MAG: NUDIX domain-containing protein [Candidatus Buchananbacteria bacterium]